MPKVDISALPPEKQQEFYDMLAASADELKRKNEELTKDRIEVEKRLNEKLEAETLRLNAEVEKREQALKAYATAGIDISKLDKLEDCAPDIGMTAEEAKYLLETNPDEFLKAVFRQYHIYNDEKVRRLEDMEMDINGDVVGRKLNDCYLWFSAKKDVSMFTPADTVIYAQKVDQLINAYEQLLEWKKIQADIANATEMAFQLTCHFAVKHFEQKAVEDGKKTKEFMYNPQEKLDEIEQKATAEKAKEEMQKQKELANEQRIVTLEQTIQTLREEVAAKAEDSKVDDVESSENEEEEKKPRSKKK